MSLDWQTCITYFCTFLCRRCTPTTWNLPISRFVEEVNTTQQFSFSVPELKYSPLKFNSSKNHLSLSHWTRWNKCDKLLSNTNSRGKMRIFFLLWRLCLKWKVAASAPVSERSVKLRRPSDSQVPQGWGLLCQLLQRSCCRTCWGERFSRFWVQQQRRFSWCLEVEFLCALERTTHV